MSREYCSGSGWMGESKGERSRVLCGYMLKEETSICFHLPAWNWLGD